MFQRARQAERNLGVRRRPAIEPARSVPSPGKRTLTESQTFGAPDRYTHAIDAARRELRAVRTVALPTFIKLRRDSSLDALAKQTRLLDAALQVRHLLLTANQHVKALEQAAPYPDPIVLFLRHDLDTLATRATKLGVYRGAEAMIPRGHVDEKPRSPSRGEGALVARKPSAAQQRAQAISKVARNADVRATGVRVAR